MNKNNLTIVEVGKNNNHSLKILELTEKMLTIEENERIEKKRVKKRKEIAKINLDDSIKKRMHIDEIIMCWQENEEAEDERIELSKHYREEKKIIKTKIKQIIEEKKSEKDR
jgi:hypothetical protein